MINNLSSHNGSRARELIKAAGAGLRYLPPYSPDFNRIENAIAKPKALFRRRGTGGALWDRLALALDAFTPGKCATQSSRRARSS